MRRWFELVTVAVVVAVLGYLTGRYFQPVAPEHAIVNSATVTVKDTARVVYREKITRAPSGATVTERTSEHTDTRAHVDEHVRVDAPLRRPDWRVGVLVGGSLSAPTLPVYGPLAVGVHVERYLGTVPILKIPVSAGVWALSSGQAGVSLSGEF